MLLRSLILLMVICLTFGNWNETHLGHLAMDLAEKHYVSCFVIVHTGERIFQDNLRRIFKVLQKGRNLRTARTQTFTQKDKFVADGCVRNLYIILGYLPHAEIMLSKFTEKPVLGNPLWLIALPKDVSVAEFIADDFLPFKPHVLTVSATDEGAILRETWRVTWGYALHVRPYAIWTSSGLSCKRKHCTFETRDDLEGYPLRASSKEDMPISGPAMVNGWHAIAGFFGLVYYDLAAQFNCTTVVLPPQSMTGTKILNGHYNGLLGLLERNESDLAVGPLSMQGNSIRVVNFLRPLLKTNWQVFFKQDGTVVEWGGFLKPFEPSVWHLVLAWFIVGALALNYIYDTAVRHGYERRVYLSEYSKVNAFMTFLRAFCQQGNNLWPESLPCRSLYLTGYLSSLVLVTAYSASLISKLTVEEPVRPFDTLEEFMKDGSYSLIAVNGSNDYTYFSEADDFTLTAIYEHQMKSIPLNLLPRGKEEGLEQVCLQNKMALFITFAVTKLAANKMENQNRNCRILYFRTTLGTVFLTIGIRKNFPFEESFNYRLQMMSERGILSRLQQQEWGLPDIHSSTSTPEVEIQQVIQVHGILMVGMVLSLIILTAERLANSHTTSRFFKWLKLRETSLDVIGTVGFFTVAFSLLVLVVFDFVN